MIACAICFFHGGGFRCGCNSWLVQWSKIVESRWSGRWLARPEKTKANHGQGDYLALGSEKESTFVRCGAKCVA